MRPARLAGSIGCLALLSIWFVLVGARPVFTDEALRLFRIGTGGATGVYYPIGCLIARGLTGIQTPAGGAVNGESGIAGLVGVAQNSAGSIENARAVTRGDIEAGMVQADVAVQAYHGQQAFAGDGAARSIRAVASLYPEKLQIVTRKDAGIRRIDDFKGKRISIDEIGSGTLAVMQTVLAVQGVSEDDFSPVYLKPVFTHEKMIRGEVQGFAIMAGVPTAAVAQLAGIDIFVVPVARDVAARINSRAPYLVPGIIAAGVYPGVPETPTIEVHALLVVGADLDEQLVYRATASLWSRRTRRMLRDGHPQGAAISLETALKGVPIPLHRGAERYYRERGLLP